LDGRHSECPVSGIGLPLGQKWTFTRSKNPCAEGKRLHHRAGSARRIEVMLTGSRFARIVVTQEQNSLGYDNMRCFFSILPPQK
jgi:hypothetical protein